MCKLSHSIDNPNMNCITSEPRPLCDLCGSAGDIVQTGVTDPDGTLDGTWSFRRCANPACGVCWLDPAPPPHELWKAYTTYHTHTRKSGDRLAKAMLSLAHRFIRLGLLPLWMVNGLKQEADYLRFMTLGHEPAGVFTHVNRFLCSHSELERYATIFFGTLDPSGQMEFINAGHPSPVLLREGTVEVPFPADCFPVGLLPEAEFKSCAYALRPGDTLVLFSDGVTEAMDPENKEFGITRLKEVLGQHTGSTVEEIQAGILNAVQEFTRGAGQADDLTLLVVRYVGPTTATVSGDSKSSTTAPS